MPLKKALAPGAAL
jgi:hypothetical protein